MGPITLLKYWFVFVDLCKKYSRIWLISFSCEERGRDTVLIGWLRKDIGTWDKKRKRKVILWSLLRYGLRTKALIPTSNN